MKYLSLIFIVFLIGCASFGSVVYSPDIKTLDTIEDKHMNCKSAAVFGQQALLMAGETSRISCGVFLGQGHCWNEVFCNDDDKWHLVDLTRYGDEGWPIDQYKEYKPLIRWNGTPDVVDLERNLGADWKADNIDDVLGGLPGKTMFAPKTLPGR